MFKDAVYIACAVGVCASIINTATPSEKFNNQLRLIIGMIMIATIATTLMRSDFSFDANELSILTQTDASENSELISVKNAVISRTADNLSQFLNSRLSARGINDGQISIELIADEYNCIEVGTIHVRILKKDIGRYDEIMSLITDEIPQGKVKISWEEENDQ